jgi:hypothetical protein
MKSLPLISLTSLFLFAACGDRTKSTAGLTPPEAAASDSVDAFFVDAAPADPQPIHLVRTTAKPGEEVTVSGRIMGRMNLFVEGRSAFILGDPAKLTPCNEIPGDECGTPWDTCCDSKEAKLEGTATIQITGADGRVLKQSLKGVHGLTELSTVTVTGTLDPASTPEAMIVNALKIHVAKP